MTVTAHGLIKWAGTRIKAREKEMKIYTYKYTNKPEITCFENGDAGDQGAGDQGAGDQGAGDQGAGDQGAGSPATKTFTQEQVNKMIGLRNKSLNEKYQALEATYTELLEQSNLTEGAREKLQQDLEQVQKQMRTKEQQIEFEQKKIKTKFETELKAANEKGEYYQSLFENSTIERAIMDAAVEHGAFNPGDFIAHLKPRTKVVEDFDAEGKKTGRLVPMVDWEVQNDEGETVKVSKTPSEVVQLMKDMKKYGNLYKSNVAAGVGQGAGKAARNSSGNVDVTRLTPDEYMKLASTDEGRRALGLKK